MRGRGRNTKAWWGAMVKGGILTRRVYEAGVLVTCIDFLEDCIIESSVAFPCSSRRDTAFQPVEPTLAWQLPSPSPEHISISSTPTQTLLSLSQAEHSTPWATSSLSARRMPCARIFALGYFCRSLLSLSLACSRSPASAGLGLRTHPPLLLLWCRYKYVPCLPRPK